jgi:uncharacterized membrane protein AbrB (regulator of aidB expression)
MSRTFHAAIVLLGPLFAASVAAAQPALKMMIPANPGGWNQTGRQLAAAMQSATLVNAVQFENKGGAAGTVGLAQFVSAAMALSVGFAALLAHFAGVVVGTMVRATALGGIAEMCITGKVVRLGVPLVAGARVARVAVLVTITAPVFRVSRALRRRLVTK